MLTRLVAAVGLIAAAPAAPVDEGVGALEATDELGVFEAAGIDVFAEVAGDVGVEFVEGEVEGFGGDGGQNDDGPGGAPAEAEGFGGFLEVFDVVVGDLVGGEVGGGHEVEGLKGGIGEAYDQQASHGSEHGGATDVEAGGQLALAGGGGFVGGGVGGLGEPEVLGGGEGHELAHQRGAGGGFILGSAREGTRGGLVAEVDIRRGLGELLLAGEVGLDGQLEGRDVLPAGTRLLKEGGQTAVPLQLVFGILFHEKRKAGVEVTNGIPGGNIRLTALIQGLRGLKHPGDDSETLVRALKRGGIVLKRCAIRLKGHEAALKRGDKTLKGRGIRLKRPGVVLKQDGGLLKAAPIGLKRDPKTPKRPATTSGNGAFCLIAERNG